MKNTLKWLLKCIAAGCAALAIACVFSFFYYNTGRHTDNPNGATDFLWEGNKFYCQMREGFAFGITDEDGFNNAYPGVTSDSDILIIGSSHMEAAQVSQDQTTVHLLNKHLDEANAGLTAYNIGLSSHNFYRCADNFEAALEAYSPSYVIIEIYDIPCSEEDALNALNGTYADVASYDGFIYDLQAVPLPKLLMQQLREFQNSNSSDSFGWISELKETISRLFKSKDEIDSEPALSGIEEKTIKENNNTRLIRTLSEKASQHGAELIIVYHPALWIDSSGGAYIYVIDSVRDDYFTVCENNGITVIDMSERFLKEYDEQHIVPHGFINSSVSSGHLNAHGHRMIAEELYKVIAEMQGEAK